VRSGSSNPDATSNLGRGAAKSFSARYLKDASSVEQLKAQMPEHPAFQGAIVEVNGTDVVQNIVAAQAIAKQLRFHNVAMSIDDLGAE
jgi:EAL domain-containing protein (putative c-di-GMP-specific phosphodiesterase class I)